MLSYLNQIKNILMYLLHMNLNGVYQRSLLVFLFGGMLQVKESRNICLMFQKKKS
ncbi:hypothetical protein ADIMK_1820 [Marinobacterium lacunae]|uniref:Uncharacterized protein n=1 Tax=Marinobacterium lacunae TaxID=1232683 RepID=A0A081FZY0_9GAMM|nr:hypothetical protein ADIMK_1820 [Marinobacterium lacunae]